MASSDAADAASFPGKLNYFAKSDTGGPREVKYNYCNYCKINDVLQGEEFPQHGVRIDPMHTMSPSAHNSNQRPKAEVVKGTTQWWKAVGAGLIWQNLLHNNYHN